MDVMLTNRDVRLKPDTTYHASISELAISELLKT
jgi:hypothetical protein